MKFLSKLPDDIIIVQIFATILYNIFTYLIIVVD